MTSIQRYLMATAAFACATLLAGHPVAIAQVTPTAPPADSAGVSFSEAELEKLVGPIALYPDDLIAIILPASTYPLQIVQASRFFDKRKANSQLQPDSTWDDSVKSLLNYPDIVKKMSDDLEWTEDLGEAVVANSSAVLDAVQAFRRKAQAAGNLKSDPKQTIVVEKEIIQIVPTDPQVIYVPQYQPSTVVVAGSPVGYYPTQYPVYYYPYPPGAALATGLIWGAAIGAAWNGGRWGTNYSGGGGNSISINNSTNINAGNRPGAGAGSGNRPGGGGGAAWKPSQKPGQVGRPSTRPGTPSRVGDAGRGGGGFGNTGGGGFGNAGGGRPSTQPVGPGGGRGDFGSGGRGDGGAFGGMGSGRAANHDSMRGQSSRASGGFSGQGGRQAGGFQQGGGARAGGAPAGGARAGGSPGGARGGGAARSGGGARGGRR